MSLGKDELYSFHCSRFWSDADRNWKIDLATINGKIKITREAGKKTGIFLGFQKTGNFSIHKLQDRFPIVSAGHRLMVDGPVGETGQVPMFRAGLEENGHFSALDVGDGFVFTSVRNLFGWFVSYYMMKKDRSSIVGPDQLLAEKYDFDDFVRAIAERDAPHPWNRLLFCNVFSHPSGKLCVDWVLRTEFLSEDFPRVARAQKWDSTTPVPHENQGRPAYEKLGYQRFYDDALRRLVEDVWRSDIELFGFDFERGYREDLSNCLLGEVRPKFNSVRMPNSR